ncbi:MAG: hypothetical protein ABTQ29_14260 [Siculibacillus sp.]
MREAALMIAAQRQPRPFRAPRAVAALLARWVRPAAPAGVPPAVEDRWAAVVADGS